MTDLHARQLALEDTMVSRGVERYMNDIEERGLSVAGPGKSLRARALEPTAAAIKVKLDFRGRGRPSAASRVLRGLDPHVLADLTMRRVLDGAAREEKVLRVTKAIGAAVEWHVKDAQLYKANRALWNRKQEQLKTTQNAGFRRRSIDGSVRSLRDWARETGHEDLARNLDDVKGIEWSDDQMVDAGVFLLDCFCEASALVTTEEIRSGHRTSKAVVRFTEGAREWLETQHEFQSLLRPVYMPMVVEPRPWTSSAAGGYLDNSKARVPFIMSRAKELERDSMDLTDAMDAVTMIQSTPFRVNRSVFDVMFAVWNAGSGIGRVPPKYAEDGLRVLQPLTERLVEMAPADRKDDKECREIFRQRRDAHEFNALFRAEVNDFTRLMTAASEYRDLTFWHPHKLDWRQRCYPVCNLLSPQGDQFNRGLLEFSRGQRMGDSENSGAWLAIHGANTFGIDKVTFEERIAWVEEHEGDIIACAIDPYENRFWTQADGGAKAWPFLAFCYEWAGYRIAGDEFVTRLPVALDGSNSGLQHLSAMVRDPDGASATNVSPHEEPADIYTEICEKVSAALGGMAVATHDATHMWAHIWLGAGIDRKICKQPTMTYTYSATLSGMVKQIEAALSELDKKAQASGKASYLTFTEPDQDNGSAARFLGPIVLEAIKGRLPRAAAAMDFLVACAKVVSKVDLPLRWVTPVNVPVVQLYQSQKAVQKEIFVDGRRHRLTLLRPIPGKIDKRASAYGVSPNFVHSMDSTHLLWTVLFCNDQFGIEDFSMIHDSFGTHATQCDTMAWVLREMFVRLYSEDRLAEFRESIAEHLPRELVDELPPLPEKGVFDLETVRESVYFFA